MLKLNTNPDRRQLRQFGTIAVIALPLIAWFWGGSPQVVTVAAVAGGLAGLLAWLRPHWLRPVFVGVSAVLFPLGVLISELVLLTLFFGVFTPLALVFRVTGRDTMQRRFDASASSYLIRRPPTPPAARYYRQF